MNEWLIAPPTPRPGQKDSRVLPTYSSHSVTHMSINAAHICLAAVLRGRLRQSAPVMARASLSLPDTGPDAMPRLTRCATLVLGQSVLCLGAHGCFSRGLEPHSTIYVVPGSSTRVYDHLVGLGVQCYLQYKRLDGLSAVMDGATNHPQVQHCLEQEAEDIACWLDVHRSSCSIPIVHTTSCPTFPLQYSVHSSHCSPGYQ